MMDGVSSNASIGGGGTVVCIDGCDEGGNDDTGDANSAVVDGGSGRAEGKASAPKIAVYSPDDGGTGGPLGTKPGGRSVTASCGETERPGRPRGGEVDDARCCAAYTRGGEPEGGVSVCASFEK